MARTIQFSVIPRTRSIFPPIHIYFGNLQESHNNPVYDEAKANQNHLGP